MSELTVRTVTGLLLIAAALFAAAEGGNIFAFLVAAILHANNLRDIDSDRARGKRTLATLIGRHWSQREYLLLLAAAYIVLLALVLLGIAPIWTLLVYLTLPVALNNVQRASADPDARALNLVIRRTANLHARFGQLMIFGFIVAMALSRLTS